MDESCPPFTKTISFLSLEVETLLGKEGWKT